MTWKDRVVSWHISNGGFNGRIAGHALRLLNEAVELCVACGADPVEIGERVHMEIAKARSRNELGTVQCVPTIREELADVDILSTVIAHHTGNRNLDIDCENKVSVLFQRKWTVDSDGVLWRSK